jgi:hypothetical protein
MTSISKRNSKGNNNKVLFLFTNLVIVHNSRMTVTRAGSLLPLGVNQPPDALDLGVIHVRRERGHHVLRVRKRLTADDPHLAGL